MSEPSVSSTSRFRSFCYWVEDKWFWWDHFPKPRNSRIRVLPGDATLPDIRPVQEFYCPECDDHFRTRFVAGPELLAEIGITSVEFCLAMHDSYHHDPDDEDGVVETESW